MEKCRRVLLVERQWNTRVVPHIVQESEHEYVNKHGKEIIEKELIMAPMLTAGKLWRCAQEPHAQAHTKDVDLDLESPIIEKRGRGRPRKEKTRTREPSAYNVFVQSIMNKVKGDYPGMTTREHMRVCAGLWATEKARKNGVV